jgi:predicted deacetylase
MTGRRERRWSRPGLGHHDRRALERAGWRTLLTYQENHVRRSDGELVALEASWIGEAERVGTWARVTAPTPAAAWARLLEVVRTADADADVSAVGS